MKPYNSAPALRRIRHCRYDRQFSKRKLRNSFKRLVELIAFASRYPDFLKSFEKLCSIIVPCVCQNRRTASRPWCELTQVSKTRPDFSLDLRYARRCYHNGVQVSPLLVAARLLPARLLRLPFCRKASRAVSCWRRSLFASAGS